MRGLPRHFEHFAIARCLPARTLRSGPQVSRLKPQMCAASELRRRPWPSARNALRIGRAEKSPAPSGSGSIFKTEMLSDGCRFWYIVTDGIELVKFKRPVALSWSRVDGVARGVWFRSGRAAACASAGTARVPHGQGRHASTAGSSALSCGSAVQRLRSAGCSTAIS